MPPATSNDALGLLITLNISLTLLGLLAAASGLITMSLMLGRQLREMQSSGERVALICERIDARLRRDFPDIGRELGD